MGLPVKLSDELVEVARLEAKAADRSLTAQIEHWATLGRAAESMLSFGNSKTLKASAKSGSPPSSETELDAVGAVLRDLFADENRAVAKSAINGHGTPLYETDLAFPSLVVQVAPDGTRRAGQFIHRVFVANEAKLPPIAQAVIAKPRRAVRPKTLLQAA